MFFIFTTPRFFSDVAPSVDIANKKDKSKQNQIQLVSNEKKIKSFIPKREADGNYRFSGNATDVKELKHSELGKIIYT